MKPKKILINSDDDLTDEEYFRANMDTGHKIQIDQHENH